jgi:hypothetical protein
MRALLLGKSRTARHRRAAREPEGLHAVESTRSSLLLLLLLF